MDAIMNGVQYGIAAICCVGAFAACAALVFPAVAFVWICVLKLLGLGGNKDE
jgi:hypothetical protein